MLIAFSKRQPDIGYCQGMNYLAALILLGIDIKEQQAEEYAFNILVRLLEVPETENANFQLMQLYEHSLRGLFSMS